MLTKYLKYFDRQAYRLNIRNKYVLICILFQKTQAVILSCAFFISTNLILDGIKDWNENPVIISVDSLETPLKDIEFPALTLCPNFEPDYTALAEELFNQFEFNCDVGDEDCDQIRESFVEQLDQTYQDVQSKVNNLKFETVYTATVNGKTPNLTGKFLSLLIEDYI